jgi:ribosomal protein S18 acetylase RimI-like enzyme
VLYVSFARIEEQQVDRLRRWLAALPSRRAEAEATYRQEGTRAEQAFLLAGEDGPVLVYVMEIDDLERAREAFQRSTLPIDLEFKELMGQVVAAPVDPERLYDYAYDGRPPAGPGPACTVRPLEDADRAWCRDLIVERWGTPVVVHGTIYHPEQLEGLVAVRDGELVGLLTLAIEKQRCEIVTLDSTVEGVGVGSALIESAVQLAQRRGCHTLWLVTTNDNLPALRFYQKRGFELVAVHPGALERSRRIKPAIPLVGEGGIPLRDELQLERPLRG